MRRVYTNIMSDKSTLHVNGVRLKLRRELAAEAKLRGLVQAQLLEKMWIAYKQLAPPE